MHAYRHTCCPSRARRMIYFHASRACYQSLSRCFGHFGQEFSIRTLFPHTHLLLKFLWSGLHLTFDLKNPAFNRKIAISYGVATVSRIDKMMSLFTKESYKRDNILQRDL